MTDLIDKIIRSKRRTIALVITQDATLEVRAPFNASLDVINKFALKKKSWIEKKKALVTKRHACVVPKKFVDGEEFIYEGNAYKLLCDDCENINISEALYFPKKFLGQANHHLTVWYKKQAIKKIIGRVDYYSSLTQLQYKSVRLTNAKRSWGSCSAKGSLNISWRLIMAPPIILDYVVVHELMHLIERNHSKQFWSRVQNVLSDYKEHENWLKQKGNTLVLS
ncbi:MAG: hypothetical protein ACD_21C00184G0002 [uncultured bacterium]|nr:MAG: hypothetical protein ACD_21C00184G0002 [uncultured bacterium]